MNRIYVVVRQDLDPGLRIAQACHSAAYWRTVDPEWYENLIVLGADNELELSLLVDRLRDCGIPVEPFHEPDCDHEMTSFIARGDAKRWLRHLPLSGATKSSTPQGAAFLNGTHAAGGP